MDRRLYSSLVLILTAFFLILCDQTNVDAVIVEGRIVQTTDRTTPIANCNITATVRGSSSINESFTTNETGRYRLDLVPGSYSLNTNCNGYYMTSAVLDPLNSDILAYNFAMVPILTINDRIIQFILYWGNQPRDLDAYMFTPWNCNTSFSRGPCNSGSASASSLYDETLGYGPESVYLRNPIDGRYEFWATIFVEPNDPQAATRMFVTQGADRLPQVIKNDGNGLIAIPIPVNEQSQSSSYKWWRIARVDVHGNGNTWDITYPNTLHTTPPSLPWPVETTTQTPITTNSITSSSITSSSITTSPITSESITSQNIVTTSEILVTTQMMQTSSQSTTAEITTSLITTSNPEISTGLITSGAPVTSGLTSSPGLTTGKYTTEVVMIPPPAGSSGTSTSTSSSSSGYSPTNVPGCSTEELKYCQYKLNDCTGGGKLTWKYCECYESLGECLSSYGCYSKLQTNFESACTKEGCADEVCYGHTDLITSDSDSLTLMKINSIQILLVSFMMLLVTLC